MLHAMLSKQGTVKDIVTIAASDDIYIQPSIEAFKKIKFAPFTLNGRPVEDYVAISTKYDEF